MKKRFIIQSTLSDQFRWTLLDTITGEAPRGVALFARLGAALKRADYLNQRWEDLCHRTRPHLLNNVIPIR